LKETRKRISDYCHILLERLKETAISTPVESYSKTSQGGVKIRKRQTRMKEKGKML